MGRLLQREEICGLLGEALIDKTPQAFNRATFELGFVTQITPKDWRIQSAAGFSGRT